MIKNGIKRFAEDRPWLKRQLMAVRNRALWVEFTLGLGRSRGAILKFRCNICSNEVRCPVEIVMSREAPSCYRCGSSLRFRSVIAALTERLTGKAAPLSEVMPDRSIVGLGLSDSLVYADRLERLFNYTNSFYHKEPRVDIARLDSSHEGRYDFVISTDVFEHVPPPVDRAFGGLFRLLKPGGVAIFSVPYKPEGETDEHFPDLDVFEIIKEKGRHVLHNFARNGDEQWFYELKFHGGPGSTLEMRLFSRPDIERHLKRAGFEDFKWHGESLPKYGIVLEPNATGLIVTMRKPE